MNKLCGIILLGLALGARAETNIIIDAGGDTSEAAVVIYGSTNGTLDVGGWTYQTGWYFDMEGLDVLTVTNVPPEWVAKLVKRWAAQGKICEVLGRHNYQTCPFVYTTSPPISVRRCTICGKEQTYNPGGWE